MSTSLSTQRLVVSHIQLTCLPCDVTDSAREDTGLFSSTAEASQKSSSLASQTIIPLSEWPTVWGHLAGNGSSLWPPIIYRWMGRMNCPQWMGPTGRHCKCEH